MNPYINAYNVMPSAPAVLEDKVYSMELQAAIGYFYRAKNLYEISAFVFAAQTRKLRRSFPIIVQGPLAMLLQGKMYQRAGNCSR